MKYPFKIGDVIHNMASQTIFTIISIERMHVKLQITENANMHKKIFDLDKKALFEQLYSDRGKELLKYYPVINNKPANKK